jgi:hypothetical protein
MTEVCALGVLANKVNVQKTLLQDVDSFGMDPLKRFMVDDVSDSD